MSCVPWVPAKLPVFLAVSFRRLGWQVSVVTQPVADDVDKELKQKEANSLPCLSVLSPAVTIFHAVQTMVDAGQQRAGGGGQRGGGLLMQKSTGKRPYELLYEVSGAYCCVCVCTCACVSMRVYVRVRVCLCALSTYCQPSKPGRADPRGDKRAALACVCVCVCVCACVKVCV